MYTGRARHYLLIVLASASSLACCKSAEPTSNKDELIASAVFAHYYKKTTYDISCSVWCIDPADHVLDSAGVAEDRRVTVARRPVGDDAGSTLRVDILRFLDGDPRDPDPVLQSKVYSVDGDEEMVRDKMIEDFTSR